MKTHKMKIAQYIVIVAMTLGLATAAHAQLGGFGKKKSGKSDSAAAVMSTEDFSKALDASVADVSAARVLFLDAQISLGKALGLKDESLLKLTESKTAITSAKTSEEKTKAITDSMKVSDNAMKQSSDLMAKSDTLGDAAKGHFLDGAVKCIDGVSAESKQIKALTDLANQGKDIVKNASPTQKASATKLVKPAADLAKAVPGDVKAGASAISQIIEFANKKGIKIPNADAAKDLLGGI